MHRRICSHGYLCFSTRYDKVDALACAVLRAEELEESVLAPFEERLLELIQDPDGPLRRMESLGQTETAESGEGASQSAPREHSEEPHATTSNFAMVEEESLKERESFDVEASSLQIRPRASPHQHQRLLVR